MVNTEQAITKQRLLESACEVFSEQGFRNSTVRDICKRADANIAAINYHFGDKERLYLAAIGHAHAASLEAFPAEIATNLTPRERLHLFVDALMHRLLHPGRSSWHAKLMAKEMVDPTPMLDDHVKLMIRPQYQVVESIIRGYLGPKAEPAAMRLAASSLVGQCLFYHLARNVIIRVLPEQKYGPEDINHLVAHIVNFTHLALSQMAKEADGGRAGSGREPAVKG
jgi:TetR/AcrR family transcriptional regulator, regulator of cefoperazone and chloramphenicol sensitivity